MSKENSSEEVTQVRDEKRAEGKKRSEGKKRAKKEIPKNAEKQYETGLSRSSEEQNELKECMEIIEEENSDLKDQLLRKSADFENFRKRMFREKEEGIKYANSALLAEMITIIDDFERAIQSAGESKDFNSFHTGVAMIEKQLVSMLEKNWGLKRFASTGEEFDPEKHQAIAIEETDEHDKSVVLEDYQKGYVLHDRVLRPAKVKVSKPTITEEPVDIDTEEKKE